MATYETSKRRVLPNGDRAEIRFTVSSFAGRLCSTVEHGQIASGVRLSFSAEIAPKGVRFGTNASAYGQTLGALPASWREVALWEAWHLNDMNAACAHMSGLPVDRAYDARAGYTCEAGSGYVYGTAWLYRPVLVAVVVEACNLFDPTNTLPDLAVIGRDGFAVAVVDAGDALGALHSLQGQSADYALSYGGWSVTAVR